MKLEQNESGSGNGSLHEDTIQEMLMLAARIREQSGGDLDDSAIQAVAEASGAPVEYVRLALRTAPSNRPRRFGERVRASFLSFDPDVRAYVLSGLLASFTGLAWGIRDACGDAASLWGIIVVFLTLGALYNCARAKDTKVAAFSGGLYPLAAYFATSVMLQVLTLFVRPVNSPSIPMMVFLSALGTGLGVYVNRLYRAMRKKPGIPDATDDRQHLLSQMLELQEKLRSGERNVTFLSVDIVGSTKLKEIADPLAVEFTFNEYHRYVEAVVTRNGGRVHSTAGDGVIAAFDVPQSGYGAGRAIQAGLFEFNTFRNKTGLPVRLRVGMHTGMVVTPEEDIKSLNFAHVIDVAAHLQKACPIDGFAVSEASAEQIVGGVSAIGREFVEAEGVRAVVWMPRIRVEAAAVAPTEP